MKPGCASFNGTVSRCGKFLRSPPEWGENFWKNSRMERQQPFWLRRQRPECNFYRCRCRHSPLPNGRLLHEWSRAVDRDLVTRWTRHRSALRAGHHGTNRVTFQFYRDVAQRNVDLVAGGRRQRQHSGIIWLVLGHSNRGSRAGNDETLSAGPAPCCRDAEATLRRVWNCPRVPHCPNANCMGPTRWFRRPN